MSSTHQYLRIPLDDIRSATANFNVDYLIGHGSFGKVYKGYNLPRSGRLITIAARRLDVTPAQEDDPRFLTEIRMLSSLNHQNLVSFLGFCDEGGEKIIVNKYEANSSLEKHLSLPSLRWMQRLSICVGAARALSYMDCDEGHSLSVIHRNIKSSKILLDENWEPRVCGFGLSIAKVGSRRHRLVLSEPCGTVGYIDPVCTQNKRVTHKSDVYSFGVVLFEVLCGRKAVREEDGGCEFLAPLAKDNYEAGKLDGMILPQVREQMNAQSLAIFSETAYHCLNEDQMRRPKMEKVVARLESAMKLQEDHEQTRTLVEGAANRWKAKNLEHLMIQLNDVKAATNNFDQKHLIGYGGYGTVYKAELNYFNSESSIAVGGTNRDEIPKKHGSVAIKRITERRDGQGEQGFHAEIEMLTRCKHQNIVSLLGFCDESHEQILVYEFASNGSLDDYLKNSDNTTTLTWLQRIKMCIDIAEGLNYLHTTIEDKERIIHRDIKCGNILLNEKLDAKISDFGLSRVQPESKVKTSNVVGTMGYIDPDYSSTGNLKKESDTYSFGVVLFEIMCGKLAYDKIYSNEDLPSTVRRRFKEGTLKEMLDPIIKEENTGIFTLNRGPNKKSLDAFIKIGCQCLAETQSERPKMEYVIQQLENALKLQENNTDNLRISLQDIKKATQNFSYRSCIRKEENGMWTLFKGELDHGNKKDTIHAKRLDTARGQHDFLKELEILSEYKHENVIDLVGYCDEMDEKIVVYENASRGGLDGYVNDKSLTWLKRLEICIDIASGLDFLHGTGGAEQEVVLHRDLSSANILLSDDWKAKIINFGRSLVCPIYKDNDKDFRGSSNTKANDISSLGVVLLEILCGRLAIRDCNDWRSALAALTDKKWSEGGFEKMVFECIKTEIDPESLSIYAWVTYQCIHVQQPGEKTKLSARKVLDQLKKALECQVVVAKLPSDYKKLIEMFKSSEISCDQKKKDIYAILSRGILLLEGKVSFSLGPNGERNEMISASQFSYKNRKSRSLRSVRESRFPRVMKMWDITNLNIKIKITTQFLKPDVSYGVHLIWRFLDQEKPQVSEAKRIYVNLKYKKEDENLHAYFATWREDAWMMTELFRYHNHKENNHFEVLLESFSPRDSGSRGIYIEGIEFRAITTPLLEVKNAETKLIMNPFTYCKELLRSESYYGGGKLTTLVARTGMKYLKVPYDLLASKLSNPKSSSFQYRIAAEYKVHKEWYKTIPTGRTGMGMKYLKVPYDILASKLSNPKSSSFQYRLANVETQGQEVHINDIVISEMLLPNIDYTCYLVFKISENCDGLHYPMIVQDKHDSRKKETGIFYFRTPSPWNLHDSDWVPKERTDRWMEVIVWKFNSGDEPKHDGFPVNLELKCHEGNMSGLILYGLEFRPM